MTTRIEPRVPAVPASACNIDLPLFRVSLFFAGLFSVLAYSLPHIRQRFPADLLGSRHFVPRPIAVALLLQQATCELRFQGDLRQRLPEEVMQFIGDTL